VTLNWQFFRIICFLQLLLTAFLAVVAFIGIFKYANSFYFFLTSLAFCFMFWLAVIAIGLLNNNYPDKPVSGGAKTIFNWVFLLNFLLLIFVFGLFFAEISRLKDTGENLNTPIFHLPIRFFIPFTVTSTLLIFHLIILFGLYNLRRMLYFNFIRRKFDFEKTSKLR
jgi:hypothetical protein